MHPPENLTVMKKCKIIVPRHCVYHIVTSLITARSVLICGGRIYEYISAPFYKNSIRLFNVFIFILTNFLYLSFTKYYYYLFFYNLNTKN